MTYIDSKTGIVLQLSNEEHVLNYVKSLLGINVPKPDEVLQYLSKYPDMIEPLVKICDKAHAYFSTDTELSVELYRDPEFEDVYLKLYIRQDNYQKDIIEQIDQFRETYGDMLENTSGWLHITTDFASPRLQHAI